MRPATGLVSGKVCAAVIGRSPPVFVRDAARAEGSLPLGSYPAGEPHILREAVAFRTELAVRAVEHLPGK